MDWEIYIKFHQDVWRNSKNSFRHRLKINFMSFRIIYILFLMSIIYTASGQSNDNPSKNNFSYKQKVKTDSATIFGEGVITTPDDEFGGTITPDGKTCYFSKSAIQFYIDVICFSEYKNGKWQTPKVAPFSGVYRDFDPVLSPDGNKMVFTSNRPVNGVLKSDYDIWMVEKNKNENWTEPVRLDTTINGEYDEHFASIASNGTIYFSSNRPGALGGPGDADFYYSKLVNGHYAEAIHLLDSVSTTAYELDCVIAPDESFLLMGVYGQKDGLGNYDIYISKKIDGKWTPSKNLGAKVNSSFRDYSPRISPDDKYLFFTSERDFSESDKTITTYQELESKLHGIMNGSGNIYQIELSALGISQPINKSIRPAPVAGQTVKRH